MTALDIRRLIMELIILLENGLLVLYKRTFKVQIGVKCLAELHYGQW